jgi:hypothetical protein
VKWALYAIAAFIALGSILTVTSVGKPRKPTTGGIAAAVIVVDAFIIPVLIIAAGRLP